MGERVWVKDSLRGGGEWGVVRNLLAVALWFIALRFYFIDLLTVASTLRLLPLTGE